MKLVSFLVLFILSSSVFAQQSDEVMMQEHFKSLHKELCPDNSNILFSYTLFTRRYEQYKKKLKPYIKEENQLVAWNVKYSFLTNLAAQLNLLDIKDVQIQSAYICVWPGLDKEIQEKTLNKAAKALARPELKQEDIYNKLDTCMDNVLEYSKMNKSFPNIVQSLTFCAINSKIINKNYLNAQQEQEKKIKKEKIEKTEESL